MINGMLSQKSGKRGARLTVRRLNRLIVGAAFCLVLVVASGNAQNATINWYRVANGGGVSTGNGCTLIGTVGQAEPGIVRAGSVALAEGFWSADAVLAPNGSLQVTLAPAGAASAGAQWQVDGGLWQSSGDTVPDLAVGSHTVAFSAVSGWITPPRQTVTITDNNTATPTGTYVIGGFSFTVNSTAITITGYSGPGGVLAIPSTLVGVNGTVTAIGQNAFQGIYGLTSVIIPEGVTSIGEEAFEGCSDLTGLSIPSSVTFIGDAAFEGCHSLPDVNIPTNVTSIGMETFENLYWHDERDHSQRRHLHRGGCVLRMLRADERDTAQQRYLHWGGGVSRLLQPDRPDHSHRRHLYRDISIL